MENLLLAGIQSIFVKFDDNVRIIMNPKSVSRIFDFFFLLYVVCVILKRHLLHYDHSLVDDFIFGVALKL